LPNRQLLLKEPVEQILVDPGACLVVDMPAGPSSMLAALLPLADLLGGQHR